MKHGRLDLLVLDGALRGLAADVVLVRLQSIRSVAKDLRSVVVANGVLPASVEGRVDAVLPHPVEARKLEEVVGSLFGDGSILQEVYPKAPSTPPSRVLVVEDNRIFQALAVERLTRAGFSVFAASNGREAVEAVRRGGFDVVLMDVQMPEVDGLDATRQIRAAESTEARLPIVGMTAHTGTDIRLKCLAAGMDVVLHKPLEFAALPLRLRQVIAARMYQDGGGSNSFETVDAEHASREHIQELVAEIGADRTAALVLAFLGETAPNMTELRSAFEGARWNEAADLAHRMAGVSSGMGMLKLSESLVAVEAAARTPGAKQADTVLLEAESAWQRARVAVPSLLAHICPKWAQSFTSEPSDVRQSGSGSRR